MKQKKAISRRAFLGGSVALVGSSAFLGGCLSSKDSSQGWSEYPLAKPEHQIYSACLQCHTACPIKVKIYDGVAVKIDGNPYATQTMQVQIPAATSPKDAARVDGLLCPKGQAGLQTLYDPYRLVRVLKRAGKRGENKWKTISFEQAIQEIVEGGYLFKDVPGEEKRKVLGLKDLYKLRDPKLSQKMAEDAKKVAKAQMSVAEFKKKYKSHLSLLIDPDHPDCGPVNNQFLFLAGRIEHGRKEFSKRFMNGGFGSINWLEHTTVCEQSHHIAYEMVTNQYHNGAWKKGKHHLKPDLYEAEFVLFFGTGAFEANFGPPYLSGLVTTNLVEGNMKIAVADPRLSKTAAKAWKWLPILPGGDAALANGIARWILENKGYDEKYLLNANAAAAERDGETSWSNATHLVRIEKDGPGRMLRASELGIGDEHSFVVIQNGKPVAVNAYDKSTPIHGELFYSGKINGIPLKTSLQLLKEYVFSKTMEEWAKLAGLEVQDIVEVAREFVRHGKKSVAEMYRGPVQHTNGYYNGQAIITLNLLMGNIGWKGGLSKGGGHWHEMGNKKGQPFPLKSMHPNKLHPFGFKITREGSHYEESTFYQKEKYPAKRPWYPHTSNVYQEALPSAQDGYPYPLKAILIHKGTPAFSIPGAHKNIEYLADVHQIPLLISCDVVIGDTSMYADYIFPDTAIWERWGTPHTTPAVPVAASKVRQPTITPLVEKVKVFGEEMPLSLEALLLGIAEKLKLPGFGKNGFGRGMDLKRPEDWYLKMVANIAAGDKPNDSVPEASQEELEIFYKARKHLDSSVYDPQKWQKAVVDDDNKNWWKQVVYVLNRGGRFETFEKYQKSGKYLPHPFKGMVQFYVEAVATTRHSYTGKRFEGLGKYKPITDYSGKAISLNSSKYPLHLITYKDILGGQSRNLPGNYWLSSIMPENPIILHKKTARELGLKDGDTVKVISADNPEGVWDLKNGEKKPMLGTIQTKEGVRPGVVMISWHYGHWHYGSRDTLVEGKIVKGDARRSKGICPNAAMRLDPVLKNVCLSDLIGGSTSFYDSQVQLVKV
ncbi:MAG: molybdopterin oxidoreductase [Planctomycetota bacterium]|nr:MAG: molybdopterin oxidoreductase [Planctomycetota bacterium]